MASNTATRLAPVVHMAEQAEREAVKKMGQAQQQLTQAAGKLQDLEHYRDDYHQRWLAEGGQGVSSQWIINYQRFMAQLETAITQQQRSVLWYQNNLATLRQHWQQCHARLEGLRTLLERQKQEALRLAEKREQKQQDEFCQRRVRTSEW